MAQGKELIKLALFGQPVKTSLSPVIHGMFADQFGLQIDYRLIEPDEGGFKQALEDFRNAGGVGCNITLPFKRQAWQIASDASAEAGLAEAANTLIRQSTGWFAHTTDGAGLISDLTENHGIDLSGQRVLILGAGGAAASILGSLLAQNPGQVVVVNRNLDRARALVDRFGFHDNVSISSWTELSSKGVFDLLINATSLGHHGEAPPLSSANVSVDSVCYDMNYFKASLPLKKRCAELELSYIDGLGMLVGQAAKSFFLWTAKRPDSRIVIEACKNGNFQ